MLPEALSATAAVLPGGVRLPSTLIAVLTGGATVTAALTVVTGTVTVVVLWCAVVVRWLLC